MMEFHYRLFLLSIPLVVLFLLAKRKLRLYTIPGPFLASFTDLDVSVATAVIGIGAGAFAARSGRAYISKQTSEPPQA